MSEVVEAQTTLRDTIAQAIDSHETPTESTQVDTRPRDEVGRFAPKDSASKEAPIESKQPADQTPPANPTPVVKPRPSSWKKDYEDHWTKLDPTLQDYISQREADYAKGVSTYKQNWDQAAPIYEAMQPFMPLLQEHNIAPQQWISNLGNAHKALVMGSPEEKLQMFARLANDYGVPLQALTGQQHDPQFSMLAQELNQIKNQWTQFQTQQQQFEQQTIQTEISRFAEGKPYFEAVKQTMAGLLQSGLASDLQSAYDKAIRLDPDIWQQQQAEAQQAKAQAEAEQRHKQVTEARAKAVSPKSSSPTGMKTNGSGKKGLRELLEEQVGSAFGESRV